MNNYFIIHLIYKIIILKMNQQLKNFLLIRIFNFLDFKFKIIQFLYIIKFLLSLHQLLFFHLFYFIKNINFEFNILCLFEFINQSYDLMIYYIYLLRHQFIFVNINKLIEKIFIIITTKKEKFFSSIRLRIKFIFIIFNIIF